MPDALKRLLSEEVRRSGSSLNDVAVGILASRFAVPFDPSGRPGRSPGRSGTVLLRMPAELKETLAARAAQRKRNVNDLIVETLTERLGGAHGFHERKERQGATLGREVASRSSASATARASLRGVEY
jgi:hypothetical protein